MTQKTLQALQVGGHTCEATKSGTCIRQDGIGQCGTPDYPWSVCAWLCRKYSTTNWIPVNASTARSADGQQSMISGRLLSNTT